MYFSSLHGHVPERLAVLERGARGVHARHEVAAVAERLERALAHAGHDPHRHGGVGGVRELDADLGDRRAQRAHAERDDVHRAAAHAARELVVEHLAHLARVAPVVRRARVLLGLRADERAVLDAGDVARIRPRQVRVRPLGLRELLERSRFYELGCRGCRTPPPSHRTSGSRPAASTRPPPPPRRAVLRVWWERKSRWPLEESTSLRVCQVCTNLHGMRRPNRRAGTADAPKRSLRLLQLTRSYPGRPPDDAGRSL